MLGLVAVGLLYIGFGVEAAQAQSTMVQGRIVGEAGEAMPFVNVQLTGTVVGAATDEAGHFAFRAERTGRHEIRASMIGYEPATQMLTLIPGDTLNVRLVLRETLVTLDEAVVTASSFATGEGETVALQSLEVVTTPGAAADIFMAIKTFPGVAMVDEGAGLFVRGGDVSETVILLDQATVVHPYKFESPTGGVFGTIPPFMVSGTVFSSGGFSAKYGNALSGVLAMESQDMPLQPNYYANVGLAAASLGINVPVVPSKLGVRFTGNQSFTDLMFRVNGQRDEFTKTPRGVDGNLSLIYQYSPSGRIKVFNFMTTDEIGVQVDEPSFDGLFEAETTTWMQNVQWTDIYREWFVQTSLSFNRFSARQKLGVLDLRPNDDTYKFRTDLERELSETLRIRVGAEVEQTHNRFRGTIPDQEGILNPDAERTVLNESYRGTRTGGYTEVEAKLDRRVVANVGVRADYHNLAEAAVVDPRLSLRYLFSKETDLRVSWGSYHQFPQAYLYNPASGNPNLKAQVAQHVIVGFGHERDLLQVRVEAYTKTYDHLVLRHATRNYANIGDGVARGVDVFAKYGAFLRTRFNGWLAYSLLDSRRLQVRDLGEDLAYQDGPSPFDITHNLTLVGKWRVIGFLNVGATYRYATGRPLTPIIDAIPMQGGSYYLPVDGAVGGERLPVFQRLDGQVSYAIPLPNSSNIVLYVALNNLLNRANVLGYDYNADYSERTPRTTNYRRFIYFGVSLTLNR